MHGNQANIAGPGTAHRAGRPGSGCSRRSPCELFRAIAGGRGGAAGVELLRSGQLSKRCLLLVALHGRVAGTAPAAAGAVGSDRRDWFDRVYREASGWQRNDPSRWERLLLRPQFDVWATQCLQELGSGRPGRLTGLADFAELPPDLLPPEPPPGSTEAVGGHELAFESRGRRWRLTLQDRGPYRDIFGYAPTGPLGAADLGAWTAALDGAWEVLVHRHPWHAEAVGAAVTTLVPLRPAADGSPVSAAARRAYGAVAASRPAGPVQLALTLVHEFLHVQLGALMDLVPLHRPDSGARFHAPWRPDPRPAGALLQGLYAHLGVADFQHQEHLAEPGDAESARESLRWRTHAAEAARTLLAGDELTPIGREFTGDVLHALDRSAGPEAAARPPARGRPQKQVRPAVIEVTM